LPEVRRVQKFGRSTLMISLPAEWVKSVGLSPGDAVNIEVLEDGSLRLTPLSLTMKKRERVLKIKKKCAVCGAVYSAELSECPNCGSKEFKIVVEKN